VRERVRAALAAYRPGELPLGGRRASAVMLLLYDHDGVECVPFQVRTHNVRHHRGEISLPGGAADASDASLLHTALRETHEEIGIAAEQVEVLGRLDDVETRGSGYRITPFVGAVLLGGEARAFARAQREVREVLYVPLGHLLSPDARAWKVVDEDGVPTPTEAFRYGEHVIWGATARILTRFVALAGAEAVA
jgi:8-oxo-dGTP pyrophosphatase MutT (NUDIX family)